MSDDSRPPPDDARVSGLRRALRPLRDGLARRFQVDATTRASTVRHMLAGHERDAASYWLQLLVAMGIATLGLVLNSAAVVIGAMLVSPLMGPLVQLGMGLAVGSGILALRALARTVTSIVVVVGAAALLTRVLPYQEMTGEIAARTAPTALDLFVAALCAVMAAYTATRDAKDAASTAAGAAIGIALVPPLCVVGWGLGTSLYSASRGAALLFTANLCAILLLAVILFLLLGFDDIDLEALEVERASESRVSRRIRALFASRYGLVLRLGLPLALVGAVFVPLRRALIQVEWEVRVRGQVEALVAAVAPSDEAVRSVVDVKPGRVTVQLVVVSDPASARRMREDLTQKIEAASGVIPTVQIVAVPDLESVTRIAEALPRAAPVVQTPLQAPAPPSLGEPIEAIGLKLEAVWPIDATGSVLGWTVRREGPSGAPSFVVVVEHLGPAIGAPALRLLAETTREVVSEELVFEEVAHPDTAATAEASAVEAWLEAARPIVDLWRRYPEKLHLCVGLPPVPEDDARGMAWGVERARAWIGSDPSVDVQTIDGWAIRTSSEPCTFSTPPAQQPGVDPPPPPSPSTSTSGERAPAATP
ncbi:MAG: DUF389 domain-containing protein [Polyangiaceae bacterium]